MFEYSNRDFFETQTEAGVERAVEARWFQRFFYSIPRGFWVGSGNLDDEHPIQNQVHLGNLRLSGRAGLC